MHKLYYKSKCFSRRVQGIFVCALVLINSLCLVSCNKNEAEATSSFEETTTKATTEATIHTELRPTVASSTTTMLTESEGPSESINEHSDLYIEGLPVEDVVTYFNEIATEPEYHFGDADPNLVRKWEGMIIYELQGNFTEDDEAFVEEIFAELASVDGFPRIVRYNDDIERWRINFTINFCTGDEFYETTNNTSTIEESDGFVIYSYYDNNIIYQTTIAINEDLVGDLRQSVICEEIFNGLGFSDTYVREDSICYAYASTATSFTEIDSLLIAIMYNESIRPGYTAEECASAIREIYY